MQSNNGVADFIITCSPGFVAISAGFNFPNAAAGNQNTIVQMQPLPAGGPPTAWHFRAAAQGVGQTFVLCGYVVCAPL
jgi:hypothetical protein